MRDFLIEGGVDMIQMSGPGIIHYRPGQGCQTFVLLLFCGKCSNG